MTDQTTTDERAKALDQFASAAAPRDLPAAPSGGGIVQEFTRQPVGAVDVAVHRDVARVLTTIKALASAAGEDWYYRFPVRDKKRGTTSFIEGPSIKLANDLARTYGNCEIDTRVMDLGNEWLIYARFTDLETGFSLTRPFQQRKNASRLGGDDDARRLDIALQIGVSKAIRNVVVNALQTFADEAFDAAKNSLVDRIGRDLENYREKTIERLKAKVDLKRVEHVIGRAAKDWLAPDIAKVIAMMKAVSDGMATLDETFPPLPAEGETTPKEAKRESVEDFAQGDTTEAKQDKPGTDKANGRAEKPAEPAKPEARKKAEETTEPADSDGPAERAGQPDVGEQEGGSEDGAEGRSEPDDAALTAAREAGAKARRQGRARGAIPEAYQEDERLMAAYLDGWDSEKPKK